ncbi:MAG TPA: MOSC N-terminal beta barrel domain-containing protein [Chthoniobacterales bacterium]|nr:MOSC N-terminal beta barrel domain-containing protein [Chthoniobacterales bacterium]
MHVKEIWRYPVKSMRGERVTASNIATSGVAGDRRTVVVSATAARLITARTHPGLLGLQASLDDEGGITINGIPWDSAAAQYLASEAAGEEVRLMDLDNDVSRFDVLPLLVATDGAIQDLDLDGRRLRPNIVIGGVPGQTERKWPGRLLRIGSVQIRVAQLRMRCVMTTFHPDTLEQDPNVLKRIVKKAGGRTALDCSVISPGLIQVNDSASVSD